MDEIVERMQESERIAHEILSIKSEIISLDERRNKDREAVRALSHADSGAKTWIQSGNLFVKTRNEMAKKLISKDGKDLDRTISELRDRLQERTRDLNRLEGKKSGPTPSIPLSRTERMALSDLLPTTTALEFQS